MTPYDRGTYSRARADGTRAIDALRLARWIAADRIDVPAIGQPVTLERDGFTITLSLDYGEGLSLDDLGYGTFVGEREDWRTGYMRPDCDDPREAFPNPDGRDSRAFGGPWYIPGAIGSLRERFNYHHGTTTHGGQSKSVALDLARQSIIEEIRSINDYGPSVYTLTVTASREGIDLGSDSLGGIELAWSDITRTDGSEYLAEVAEDLIREAIASARDALARLAVPA